uniref:Uncharacterized protein n=1 Tax=Ditylenchus dipsaci TaxID=166011 RepID=A0A915DCS0_9BILA
MSSSSLTNGNDGYHSLSSNGIVIGSASSSSSINSSSTPNLLACLSSNARALPPASELLSLPIRSKGINEEGNRQFAPNGNVGIPSGQQGLPSISSFGQKPPTPSMQQPIPSPCIPPPPSPYLLPPSNYQYQCMTEPGTPAMGFINPNGIGEQHQQQAVYGIQAHSPSFASSMHGSNPGSIMSAPPESPASASATQSGIQFSPSIKNPYNVRMASSTPDYSLEINHSNNFYPVDGSHSNDGYSMPNINSRSTPVQQLYMTTTSNANPQQNSAANTANRAYKSPNYQNRGEQGVVLKTQ